MLNTDLKKTTKFIFFPALLLYIFLSFSSNLFDLAINSLLTSNLEFFKTFDFNKYTILAQIILTVAILIFSIYKPFEKVFKGTFLTLIGLLTVLTGLIFFQKHLVLTNVSEAFGEYKPLMMYWPTSIMLIVLTVCNFSLYSLFIWGFINRLVSLSEGIKYYIPLAFILNFVVQGVFNTGFMFIEHLKWPLMGMLICAITFMVCSFFIFIKAWKRLPDRLFEPEKTSISKTGFPYVSAAYLLAGSAIINKLLDFIIKARLTTLFPSSKAYTNFLNNYLKCLGLTSIGISIIWLVLGTWLFLKKGWKKTALYASLSIVLGGIIFFNVPLSWLSKGFFQGLTYSTTSVLFFPLIQILYLRLPYKDRFKTKIGTEMIALPIMQTIPSLLTAQRVLVLFGSIFSIMVSLMILVAIFIILIIVACYKARPKTLGTG